MSKQEYIQRLFSKYLENEASPEEIRQLMQQAELPHNEDLLKELMNKLPVPEEDAHASASHERAVKEVIGRLMETISRQGKEAGRDAAARRVVLLKKSWLRYGAAAALVMLVMSGVYLLLSPSVRPKEKLAGNLPVQPADKEPGKEGAVLTLADGSMVVLDSLGNGLITTQNNTSVMLNNGRLTYGQDRASGEETLYNTLTTPRGRQFRVILGDGTKVWLNSASTLRYPVAFSETEREVEISGEVYFEVAKDANRRFVVKAGNTHTEVLGTRFNINAYADEPSLKTTLLEGAIIVKAGAGQYVLRPGEQASCNARQAVSVAPVNTEDVIAWKNGFFNFTNADITTIMRSLARWYDLEVVYEGTPPPVTFRGKIQRNLQLSDVLEFLKNDVHFEREGNKIIIKP